MSATPFDWTVAIVGRWNRAILTPAGIATRLFQLDAATPLEIEVPTDGLAPFRVRHEGLVVLADWNLLRVSPDEPSYESLQQAKCIAERALDSLPETPVAAAGVNERYRVETPSPELVKQLACGVDDAFSDASLTTVTQQVRRAFDLRNYNLNLDLSLDQSGTLTILLNYEKRSDDAGALRNWLDTPIADFSQTTSRVLTALGISREEVLT